MIRWIRKLRKLFEPRYRYGYVERKGYEPEASDHLTEPARLDRKTGRVQFILTGIGKGTDRVWHNMGEGWQQFFKPYREDTK